MSDQSKHPWGRRRPYILFGAVTTCISCLVFAYSRNLGELAGDEEGDATIATWIAVIAFWSLDFCL